MWLPRWLTVKNPPANAGDAGDTGDVGSIAGSGRSPEGGNGNPSQYSCLGNPMNRGAWQATVLGVAKSQARLSMHTFSLRCCVSLNHSHDPVTWWTVVYMYPHIHLQGLLIGMALSLIPCLWLSEVGGPKPTLQTQPSLKEGFAREDESRGAWSSGCIIAFLSRMLKDDRWSADSAGKSRLAWTCCSLRESPLSLSRRDRASPTSKQRQYDLAFHSGLCRRISWEIDFAEILVYGSGSLSAIWRMWEGTAVHTEGAGASLLFSVFILSL